MKDLPREMRALVMDGLHADARKAVENLRVATLPVPALTPNHVLVRIDSAPCNPADLLLLQGKYGITRELPGVPGLEGSGVVVASGGGLIANWLNGKRVICGGHDATGTWAEYSVVSATNCLPLRYGLSLEQGATALANPMTALAMVALARGEGHRALVNTAAAGQLGRMIFVLAREAGLAVINVVRRADQADALREIGADRILDSSDTHFDRELKQVSQELGATLAFDAVAGEMTGRLLRALPERSSVVVYGALSGDQCGNIDPMALAFGHKQVRGFEIAAWLREAGLFRSFRLASKAQRLVASGRIKTEVAQSLSLDEAREGLLGYVANMSKGKVLVRPVISAS